MPEFFALFAVSCIAVGTFLLLKRRVQNPAAHDPRREQVRREHQIQALDERLAQARREQWGHEMIARLEAERARAGADRPTPDTP